MARRNTGLGSGAAVAAAKRTAPAWGTTTTDATSTPTAVENKGIVHALRGAEELGDTNAPLIIEVQPDEVAPHPRNARTTLGDLDELVESLKTFGLMQPILVMSAADFRAADPQYASEIGTQKWVCLAGHRRRAAAELAELPKIHAIVRPDLANAESSVTGFVTENLHRAELSPLDEARAYDMLADLGLSQREIAARCAVSQGHVSKRLSLRYLPQPAQDALEKRELLVSEATALAMSKPQEDQVLLWEEISRRGITVATAKEELLRQREERQRIEDAKTQASAAGLRLVEPGIDLVPTSANIGSTTLPPSNAPVRPAPS